MGHRGEDTRAGTHLLLGPFHLQLAPVSLLRHIGVGVLVHGLLSILPAAVRDQQPGCERTKAATDNNQPPGLGSERAPQENLSGGFGFSGNSTGLHGDLTGFNGQ